jgi:hypothetical protein
VDQYRLSRRGGRPSRRRGTAGGPVRASATAVYRSARLRRLLGRDRPRSLCQLGDRAEDRSGFLRSLAPTGDTGDASVGVPGAGTPPGRRRADRRNRGGRRERPGARGSPRGTPGVAGHVLDQRSDRARCGGARFRGPAAGLRKRGPAETRSRRCGATRELPGPSCPCPVGRTGVRLGRSAHAARTLRRGGLGGRTRSERAPCRASDRAVGRDAVSTGDGLDGAARARHRRPVRQSVHRYLLSPERPARTAAHRAARLTAGERRPGPMGPAPDRSQRNAPRRARHSRAFATSPERRGGTNGGCFRRDRRRIRRRHGHRNRDGRRRRAIRVRRSRRRPETDRDEHRPDPRHRHRDQRRRCRLRANHLAAHGRGRDPRSPPLSTFAQSS